MLNACAHRAFCVLALTLAMHRSHCFEVATPDATFYMCAEAEKEKDEWIGAIGRYGARLRCCCRAIPYPARMTLVAGAVPLCASAARSPPTTATTRSNDSVQWSRSSGAGSCARLTDGHVQPYWRARVVILKEPTSCCCARVPQRL